MTNALDSERVDAWLERALGRYSPPLTRPELNRGVRSLSDRYVHRRAGGLAGKAVAGQALRAAFACYYAPLHLTLAHHIGRKLVEADPGAWRAKRVVDLGCGTGVVGVGLALGIGIGSVDGLDSSPWALSEARQTALSMGVRSRFRRGSLPGAMPWPAAGDLICAGWALNELDDEGREDVFKRVSSGLRKGAALVIIEPLSGRIAPWLDDWGRRLAPQGAQVEMVKQSLPLPRLVQDIDKATGLDHRVLGARVLSCGVGAHR